MQSTRRLLAESKVDAIHAMESISEPAAENNQIYEHPLPAFARVSVLQVEIAKMMK